MNVHGELTFEWLNNVLYVRTFGPFNEEGIVKAANAYSNCLSQHAKAHYAIIEIWDNDSLGSPEVMAMVADFWTNHLQDNCTAIAIVVSNSLQLALCQKLLPPSGSSFGNVADAELWVNRMLIPNNNNE
ncbi:hypothetical protein HII17_10530 [Thalassotalea sp. M1531]|uniref:STAS/SEC14 domain-containing protein n=1 Tax=Thalassotalea algicola TaxID=2716224 RepID=A0A7Y0LD52_9GAMM|nr:hypothetical protein [Thalassotalea algicola]NMP32003.1 hypothetical protein [Thalassotalea algicola]